jgi:hypothetical protein
LIELNIKDNFSSNQLKWRKKNNRNIKTLININNDRIKGYVTASIETQEQDLKNLFAQLSTTSLKIQTVTFSGDG